MRSRQELQKINQEAKVIMDDSSIQTQNGRVKKVLLIFLGAFIVVVIGISLYFVNELNEALTVKQNVEEQETVSNFQPDYEEKQELYSIMQQGIEARYELCHGSEVYSKEDLIKCEQALLELDIEKIEDENIVDYYTGLIKQQEALQEYPNDSWEQMWSNGFYARCKAINKMIKNGTLQISDEIYIDIIGYLLEVEIGYAINGDLAFVSDTEDGDYTCSISVTNVTGADLQNVHLRMDWNGEIVENARGEWKSGEEWTITWGLPTELLLQYNMNVLIGITEYTAFGTVKSDNTYLGEVHWEI